MSDAAECHIIDAGEDDDVSAHSAISNASDFEEDEQVDYLALELVHHLPAEKATKLLKNMRAKEKAVQDLLHRNRRLLDSCKRLDEENQTLCARLKELETAEIPPAPEVKPAEVVDSSVFLRLERGKEEQILLLKKDNERLRSEVHRLNEGGQGLEEALTQARKDLKKLQQGRKANTGFQEEDRLYKDLQGRAASDLVVARMQQKHVENRAKVQGVLQALVSDDLQRIKRWSSDVAAVLLAVEGLEGQLKPRKKSKAEDSQMLSEIDDARSELEEADKAQLSLEEMSRDLSEKADSAAGELDVGLAAAEREVEWIREENAAWVERAQAINLEPMAATLGRSEKVLASLLSNAPPGLLPANVAEAHTCVADLSEQLAQRAQSLATLTEQSIGLGRRVRTLQAAHRTVRAELQRGLTRELGASARALEPPLQVLHTRLRHGAEALGRARSGGERSAGPPTLQSEFREVHAMGRALIASLEEGGRAFEERMEQVFAALSGDPRPEEPRPEEPRNVSAEAKKKRGKKKSRAEPEQRQEPTDEESQVRVEIREAFEDSEATSGGRVLTGPELLHELQSLRSDAEALEARMAERLRSREQPGAEADALAAKPKMQRRRKMYV